MTCDIIIQGVQWKHIQFILDVKVFEESLSQSVGGAILKGTDLFISKSYNGFVAKCNSYSILLQNVTGITKCDNFYKVQQYVLTIALGLGLL